MLKFILIYLLLSFSYVSALTEAQEEEILVSHQENIQSVDQYLIDNKKTIRTFLQEGGRCNDRDTSYIKGLRSFFDHGKNIPFAQELDYETNKEYIVILEKKDLLEEKRELLKSGATLVEKRELSDGTKFTQELIGYNGIYDDEIEELENLSNEIISDYRIRHIKERGKNDQLQTYVAASILQRCIDVREEIKVQDQTLHNKLDKIESNNPGALRKILPQLEEIREQDKYKRHFRLIDLIIGYIRSIR